MGREIDEHRIISLIRKHLLIVERYYEHFSYQNKNIGSSNVEKAIAEMIKGFPEIIKTLESTLNLLKDLRNTNKIIENYERVENTTIEQERIIRISNEKRKDLISKIDSSMTSLHISMLPIEQIITGITELTSKAIQDTIIILEESMKLNKTELTANILSMQQSLEEIKEILRTLSKLIMVVRVNYINRMSEKINPGGYANVILIESETKSTESRFKILITALKERILSGELRNKILLSKKYLVDILEDLEEQKEEREAA